MRLFLVGYMGCGKSTLGRKIASKLEAKFIDMDDYIQQQQGMTIAEIFSSKGEEGFRKIESNALDMLLKEDNVVVATGGGAPCFFDNMERINNSALSIYIDPGFDALVARLKGAKQKRPLIMGKSDDELREFIKESLDKREPFYCKAKVRVQGRNIMPRDIIEIINMGEAVAEVSD